jgi:hypothetical protein
MPLSFCSRSICVVALVAALVADAKPQSDLTAFDGEWIFVEDRTEGRALEQMNPPMGSKFIFKVEEGAVVLVWGHGGNGNRNVRVPLDGKNVDIPGTTEGSFVRYRGSWKEGVLAYEMEFARAAGQAPEGLIRREFRITSEGLIVKSNLEVTPGVPSVGLYRHPQDIPMPTPAKATLADLKWLEGNWSGTRTSGASIEERWSPAKGGAMLAVSRSVNTRGQMFAFEYLRIVERDGGLVYIAQPNGAAPTEFVLSELTAKRAVFDNPRHDYPKRIVYELFEGGTLTATIGFLKGGTPGKFEYKREGG